MKIDIIKKWVFSEYGDDNKCCCGDYEIHHYILLVNNEKRYYRIYIDDIDSIDNFEIEKYRPYKDELGWHDEILSFDDIDNSYVIKFLEKQIEEDILL